MTSTTPTTNIPTHVAIIMDGNGRWAQNQGLDRTQGHIRGVDSVREITAAASDAGVKYLTLYAFSTENWHRPTAEVDALMNLIALSIEKETPSMIANNVKVTIIGDFARLPQYARESLLRSVDATSKSTGLNLILAISYSARWEITEAMRRVARAVADNQLSPDDITDDTVASNLATAGIPDPDLLIRTGGDLRISNFLLWQIAYAEIVVTPTLWPDFDRRQFALALEQYSHRQRRFGLTGDQVTANSETTK